MKIYSRIKEGHLSDQAEIMFWAALATHEDKDIEILIQRKRQKRSLNQNAYYWSVVVPMCRDLLESYGNELDDEETHSFLKEHIGKLTASVVDAEGKRKAIVKSSAALTTAEFEAYILKITAWAAGESVLIPQPNEHLHNYLTA